MSDRRLAWATIAVILRYLATIQPQARRELARWRRHVRAIPDPELREHVLRPFDVDRSAEGAALFAVLAPIREQRQLVRLLIAYVLLWSYVDVHTERHSAAGPQAYDLLVDALRSDVFAVSAPAFDDGGYLAALLAACRSGCAALPSWEVVEGAARRLADDSRTVQALNHGPPADVEIRLLAWAGQLPRGQWLEHCASASSPLAIHALMALATRPEVLVSDVHATAVAYGPVSALGVLCDHLIDESEDRALTSHSYMRYLGPATARADQLSKIADRAARSVRGLAASELHVVILAAMTAMFLSNQQAWSPANTAASHSVIAALGPPTPLLLAMLRMGRRLTPPRSSHPAA